MNNFNYKCLGEIPDYLLKLVKDRKHVDEQHMITIYEVNDTLNDLFPNNAEKWPCEDSGLDRMD